MSSTCQRRTCDGPPLRLRELLKYVHELLLEGEPELAFELVESLQEQAPSAEVKGLPATSWLRLKENIEGKRGPSYDSTSWTAPNMKTRGDGHEDDAEGDCALFPRRIRLLSMSKPPQVTRDAWSEDGPSAVPVAKSRGKPDDGSFDDLMNDPFKRIPAMTFENPKTARAGRKQRGADVSLPGLGQKNPFEQKNPFAAGGEGHFRDEASHISCPTFSNFPPMADTQNSPLASSFSNFSYGQTSGGEPSSTSVRSKESASEVISFRRQKMRMPALGNWELPGGSKNDIGS
eukprot:TRINITY_DN49670_c0_g2_i2.p1 TRINITY_DN49670_c0_g2~~TRINITY_DN49670_c0_g2_i2.p1  ORF type:complete len:311 (-),score=43.27 TRINITY_DN49670_c0_g2_i2:548-1414(-)